MQIKIGILLVLVGASSAFADPAYAQLTRISLDANDARLETVLDEIENRSEFYFIFNQKQIDVERVVNVNAENELIGDILADIFAGTEVNYEVFDRKILLTTEAIGDGILSKSPNRGLQQQTITGTITDAETGEPLPGVNVLVRGTTTGVLTDIEGQFSLSIPDPQAVLVFSFIGYTAQEVPVAGQNVLNIRLVQSLETLDEVVVVGYGTQKKVSLTGAISAVGEEELNKVAVGDALSRLQGQIAGVTITNNWRPGAGSTVRIRGYGSLGNNNPLYVIDGVPRGSFDNINPNDIESLSVLKDASSAAIYGTRAANGVILITTKKGKEGRARLTFNARRGFQFTATKPDLMNAEEIGQYLWQKFKNMGLQPGDIGWGDTQYGYGPEPVVPDYIFPAGAMLGAVDESTYTTPDVKPFNSITRANKGDNLWDTQWSQGAPIEEYNLNFSGGTGGSVYSLSTGYYSQKGIYNFDGDDISPATNNGFRRYSLRANSSFKVNDWVTFNPIFYTLFSEQLGSTDRGMNMFLHPIIPIYDVGGNYAGSKIPNVGNQANPIASLVRNKDDYSKRLMVQASMSIDVKFTKDILFKSLFGTNFRNGFSNNRTLADPEWNQTNNTASLAVSSDHNFQYNWINTVNYMKSFGEHSINLLAGTEILDQMSEDVYASRTTYAFEDIDYMVISSGESDVANSGSVDRSKLFSYFGRINYDFGGKYLLEGVIRRDASSRFVGKYRWGTFPAFSVGWRVSEEAFMESISWINNLKLRGGWGQNGNDNVGNYNAYSTFLSESQRSYYNITGASRSSVSSGFTIYRIGNEDARWETNQSTNLGLDISLFGSRIEASFDVFDRRTKDMLYDDTKPAVTIGLATLPDRNIGEMKNTGFESIVTYHGGRRGSDFSYSATVNLTSFRNEVVKLNENPDESIYSNSTEGGGYQNITRVGYPINSFYGYIFDGFFNSDEEVATWAKYSPNAAGVDVYSQPGVMKFRDITGDGIINNEDRVIIGDGYPDLSYGFKFDMRYKNWDFAATLQGVMGRDILWDDAYRQIMFIRQDGNYLRSRLYESWTQERYDAGAKITLPISIENDAIMQIPSTFFMKNGDYARMKDLMIGYNLPRELLAKVRLSSLRVFVQSNNLFTITKYEGLDPEVSDNGVDTQVYPTPRIFTVGISLGL